MKYPICLKSAILPALGLTIFLAFSTSSCSRKSGCPAENVHVKTDADGMPKAGKTKSGLLPPKAGKKKRKS